MGRFVGKKGLQQEWEEKKGRGSNNTYNIYVYIHIHTFKGIKK